MSDRRIISAQSGPQRRFLQSSADIAVYGGAAGSGKTMALLLEPMYSREVPGFQAVIFRRTVPQIRNAGGLWQKSMEIYPLLGGTGFSHTLNWVWPNGFTVSMRHLEREEEIHNWQGTEVPLLLYDELSHFTQGQFTYMLSRCRSMSGQPGRIRGTCNADADSWLAKFLAWWIDQETGLAIEERSGLLRWMGRDQDEIIWGETKAAIEQNLGPHSAMSVTYIPGKLDDNPALVAKDPGYRARLRSLSWVDRQRLEHANWKTRASAGNIFRRGWWKIEDRAPARFARVLRYWDRAASDVTKKNKDPDWTVGLKMGKTHEGLYWVLDIVRLRGTPAAVETAIVETAKQDGAGVECWLEHDPGQSGKVEASHYLRSFPALGIRFNPVPTTGKIERAQLVSPQVEHGHVFLVRAPWNDSLMSEAEAFPQGNHDDQIDGLSGAFGVLSSGGIFRIDTDSWMPDMPSGADRAVFG